MLCCCVIVVVVVVVVVVIVIVIVVVVVVVVVWCVCVCDTGKKIKNQFFVFYFFKSKKFSVDVFLPSTIVSLNFFCL